MRPEVRPENVDRVPRVVKAICFQNEDLGFRTLAWASEIGEGGGFLICLFPPKVGSDVTIVLDPDGPGRVDPMRARVIGTRIDPANVYRTGFYVAFCGLDSDSANRIRALATTLQCHTGSSCQPTAPCLERRRHPRVVLDLAVRATHADGTAWLRVINISASGALLAPAAPAYPAGITTGTRLRMSFRVPAPAHDVEVSAEVRRISSDGTSHWIGVEFVDTDDAQGDDLRRLIEYALSVSLFPTVKNQ